MLSWSLQIGAINCAFYNMDGSVSVFSRNNDSITSVSSDIIAVTSNDNEENGLYITLYYILYVVVVWCGVEWCVLLTEVRISYFSGQ